MKNYRFAQLFVKISRIIGIVVLISGIGFTVLNFFSISAEYTSAKYERDDELTRLLVELEDNKQQTLTILRNKRLIGSRNFYLSEAPEVAPLTSDQFEDLAVSLSAYRSETLELKQSLLESFEDSVGVIRDKLLKFAESLEEEAPRKNVPARRESSISRHTMESHIFDENSRTTFSEKIYSIQEVADFLARLRDESSQEESKRTLTQAKDEVEQLLSLFPNVSVSQTQVSEEPEEKETLRAEMVAYALEEAIITVRNSVTDRWAVETALAEASQKSIEEKQEMEESVELRRGILLLGVGKIFSQFLGTVLASFLILVISDFLQTQLDIAANSFVLASK